MKSTLDYRDGHLCILNESEPGASVGCPHGSVREWYAVREAAEAEMTTLLGRPVIRVESEEGLYVDEEGSVFQLLNKSETKPIAVEHLPNKEKPEIELPPKALLNGKKTHRQNGDSKGMQRKNRNNGRKRQVLPTTGTALQLIRPERTAAGDHRADATSGAAYEAPVQLNLRQKLAEVRRRIGYFQKCGHN